jgi:hypothetical protein
MSRYSWYFFEGNAPHGGSFTDLCEQVGDERSVINDKCIHTFAYTSDAEAICRAHNQALEKALEFQKIELLAENVSPYFEPRDASALEHVLQPQPPAVLGLDGRLKYFIPNPKPITEEAAKEAIRVKLKSIRKRRKHFDV